MTTTDKERISELLRQKKEAMNLSLKELEGLTGLKSTNLSFILNDKWREKIISDRIWNDLAQSLGEEKGWATVETPNYRRIHNMCADALKNSNCLGLSAPPGSGKSYSLREFKDRLPKQVFYIECHGHWTVKDFLNAIKKAIGLDILPCSITQSVDDIVAALLKRDKSLIILDEVDELREPAFRFIKTFYNDLFGKNKCGMLISGGMHLRKRMEKGLRTCKQSYQEIHSRVGKELKPLRDNDQAVITAICQANGITDKDQIKDVFNHSQGDLRAAQRRIHAFKLKLANHENNSRENSEAEAGNGHAA